MPDPETALVQQLRALGGALADGKQEFVVRQGGSSIEVSYSGGSSASVSLRARYDDVARADHPALARREALTYRDGGRRELVAARPLAIELRPETAVEVFAKKEGVSAEWQSGDDRFDRAVYVRTHVRDEHVLSAVLGEPVRRAVLELFAIAFTSVFIDDDGWVRAHLTEFASSASERPTERGARAIAAFSQILGHLPTITASGRATERPPLARLTLLFKVIGLVGWATNVGYAAGVLALLHELHVGKDADDLPLALVFAAVAVGIVAGWFGAVLYAAQVRMRVHGTSQAHDRVTSASFSAFGGISVITFTIVLVVIVIVETASSAGSLGGSP